MKPQGVRQQATGLGHAVEIRQITASKPLRFKMDRAKATSFDAFVEILSEFEDLSDLILGGKN